MSFTQISTIWCSVYSTVSVVSDSSRLHGLQPSSLLCPWDSPGKDTGGGVAMSFSRGSSPPRDQTCVSYVSCTGEFFPTNAIWEAQILVESELHRARSRGARSQEAGVVLQSAVRVEEVLKHCQCHASWPGRGTDRGRAFLVEGRVRAKAQKNGKPSPRSPSSHQCHLYSPRSESPARLFPLLPHTA